VLFKTLNNKIKSFAWYQLPKMHKNMYF